MSDDLQPGGPVGSSDNVAAEARGVWKTRTGFILAAIGSAVGLGNMWRFPYLTAEEGGAAFVLLYLIMTLVLGIPVMIAEFALGRRTRLSPIGALAKEGGPAWSLLGYLFVAAGFLILAYYAVIAGWVTRYALTALISGLPADSAAFFESVSTGAPAILFHLFFMALTIGIVAGGVQHGIERWNMVMMPLLFLLMVGLAVWAFTLPGSGDGYAFYLTPDLEAVMSLQVLGEAASQAFFSLSLGMGAMLTYASYLSRDSSLPKESTIVSFSDFGVAFFAGLVVFPIIFALGIMGLVSESAIGALFIALPAGFAELGVVGRGLGFLFFLALFIGAITSTISLLEVVTSSAIDQTGMSRRKAAIIAGLAITALGLWPATNIDVLGAMDAVAGTVLLPLGALGLSIFVGWVMRNPESEVAEATGPGVRRLLPLWKGILRFVAPVLLVLVLYYTVQAAGAAVSALFD
ncbi:MAG: sodium-dependent transporter [Longimicrobiales bacterium]